MTTVKKRILSGMFALTLGLMVASPGRALADEWRHWGHNEWREHHDGDRDDASRGHYRDWYRPGPRNGEGMINRSNPKPLLGLQFRWPSLPLVAAILAQPVGC